MTFVVGASGVPSLLTQSEQRALTATPRVAFQSYPALLVGEGERPSELGAPGRGVDVEHRDSRIAIGITRDGQVIVALTRFAALGPMAETFPYGPTVGEMSDFMRSLGCRRAMLLDGGLSSQLAIRRADGTLSRWPNWRADPGHRLGSPAGPTTWCPGTAPIASQVPSSGSRSSGAAPLAGYRSTSRRT